VHIHAYYVNEFRKIIDTLQNKLTDFDLFVTTNSLEKKEIIGAHLKTHTLGRAARKWEVIQTPDRGRNIGPLLIDIFDRLTEYDCVLHLHSKRSEHWGSDSHAWTESLHENLAGSAELIKVIRSAFNADPKLGLLIPQTSEAIRPWVEWGRNFSIAKIILQGMGHDLNLHIEAPLIFPVGMMFWFRPSAIAKLSDSCQKLQPLPLEPLPLDGSPLHAIERLVAHSCEASGYRWQLICAEETHDRSQHLDHQPSVLAPLTETYIRASSILGVEMRKLQIEMKNSVQSYENRIQQEAEALHLCQEELGQTKRKLELVEGELVRAQEEILALIDLNRVQSNRLSARVASGTVAAVAAIFNRSSYRKIYQRIYSNANEQASKN
jgi:lipopolysaccharide biosynthesis protein